jgi:para-nitrobenzyl esterase
VKLTKFLALFAGARLMMTTRIVVAAVGLLAALANGGGSAQAAAPIKTEAGLLSGAPGRDAAVTVYKGVPFAAPPVGALRWRAPIAAARWRGVKQATRFGDACPQPVQPGTASESMSEDCLTLNVWSVATSPAEHRPVFVWIYGGGFIQGSAANPQFDGEGLARKGLVVVTFNYRLGALGFLSTTELNRESGHAASGNYGILDQIAALNWVKKNITAVGGDPTQVTIAGQSAGAGSVGFLAMSPLSKGLFQRAIAESHARYAQDLELRFLPTSYRRLRDAEAAGEQYTGAHGAHSLKALRAMPWRQVIEGSDAPDEAVYTGGPAKPPMFRPVVDGWVIPHNYSETFAGRAQNNVVFVAGNNRDETGAVPRTGFGRLRAMAQTPRAGVVPPSLTLPAYVAAAKAKFGAMAEEFLKLYPATNDEEAALANNAAVHDNMRISTYLWAVEWSNGVTRPVYTYWWTHEPPGPDQDIRGAYHGSEINYVFDNLYATNRPWTEEDRNVADTMSTYWANIAKTGNPNGPGVPNWPQFDAAAKSVMRLGDRWGPIAIATPDKLDFWVRFFRAQDAW